MAGRNSPWGSGGGSSGDDGEGGEGNDTSQGPDKGPADRGPADKDGSEGEEPTRPGPRNPWLPSGSTPPRRSASIEDIFRSRDPRRSGGGGPRGPGGGFPQMPRRADGSSWAPYIAGLVVVLLLGLSSFHQLGPKEQGVVTRFGKFSGIIDSGITFTLPWPIDHVEVADVRSFNVETIPEGSEEKLMLTSDNNLVDLTYLVRWNIKDLRNYTFRLADPRETVREVAETAMRASIAQISLADAISGDGRAKVEQDVRDRMQKVLDYYKAGVAIQGVEIKKSDPPAKTKAAFDQVTVAKQDAERDRSNARAWAQQKLAEAEGNAEQFDKVYAEYKLAPEVTKQRLYYETMDRVLHNNDTVVADAKNVTSYLPLSELNKRAAAASDSAASSAKGDQ
ncbi:protease modulator HflK [Novosphingobium sp. 1949]|uniref:Protease modulator HflK n=2 Tax=Novosphingobium organovorum TaxID=2930092 RepID=A0ABT0BAB8_9SPHN|nr:protease modulator HflK [Novosphingobium organovorum]